MHAKFSPITDKAVEDYGLKHGGIEYVPAWRMRQLEKDYEKLVEKLNLAREFCLDRDAKLDTFSDFKHILNILD